VINDSQQQQQESAPPQQQRQQEKQPNHNYVTSIHYNHMMIVFCMCTYCSKLVSLSGSVWLAKMTWHIFWPLGTSFLHEAGGN